MGLGHGEAITPLLSERESLSAPGVSCGSGILPWAAGLWAPHVHLSTPLLESLGLGQAWVREQRGRCLRGGEGDRTRWAQLRTQHSLCFIIGPLVFQNLFHFV